MKNKFVVIPKTKKNKLVITSLRHVGSWGLLMSKEEEQNRGKSRDQENHIEPPVIEIKLKVTQDFAHDDTVLRRHVHSH